MNNVCFYRGYIIPNENFNCYIFKYTDEAYLLIIINARGEEEKQTFTNMKLMDEYIIDNYLEDLEGFNHFNLVEINRIGFYSFTNTFSPNFIIEIARTDNNKYFTQMYSKKFCGKWEQKSKEKIIKIEKTLVPICTIIKNNSVQPNGTYSVSYNDNILKTLFKYKRGK